MDTSHTDQPDTESALAVVSIFAVDLGVICTALFPFLIPGIAIVALFAVPFLPIAIVAAIMAAVFLAVRGLGRRISRRARTRPARVLPSLVLIGVGFGLTLAPSFATATFGVPARDSGVASAMVNTSQQVGGSIGTALLSTLAVSATTDFLTDHGPAPEVLRQAAVEGYVTAFWWAAGIFALGALICGALLRSEVRPEMSHGAPEPVPTRA